MYQNNRVSYRTLQGSGKGGRNQEIALSAALQIDGIRNAAVFSIGSDGTDGPTGTNVNDVAVILIGKNLPIDL